MGANQTVFKTWTEICHEIFAGWEVQSIVKSTKEYYVYRKACFSQKEIYKRAKHGFAITNLSWKDSPMSENSVTLRKRKSSGRSGS